MIPSDKADKMRKSGYALVAIAATAALIIISSAGDFLGLVTLEPGKQPAQAALEQCGYNKPASMQLNACCQAVCRSYCARDALCIMPCAQACIS